MVEAFSGGPRAVFSLSSLPALGAEALQSNAAKQTEEKVGFIMTAGEEGKDAGVGVTLGGWWLHGGSSKARRLQGEREDMWRSSTLVAQMEKERSSRGREEVAPEGSPSIN